MNEPMTKDLPPQLRALETELAEARSHAHRLAGVSAEEWSRRPAPGRWSVGEQIIHLNLTSRSTVPGLEKVIRKAREGQGTTGEGPFRRGLLGWLVGVVIEPPVRLRIKTSPALVPGALEPPDRVIEEFDRHQDGMMAVLQSAAGLDLNRIRVRSPLGPRYSLYSGLRFVTAHQRRHLWLAEQALRAAR